MDRRCASGKSPVDTPKPTFPQRVVLGRRTTTIVKLAFRSALAAALAARACAAADGPWRLQWADDFTAPTLNAAFWTVRDNATHGDRELELYLADDVLVDAAAGTLVVRTQRRNASFGAKPYSWTSGWLDTAGKVELTYGKLEARIRAPAELSGVWPTFWLVQDVTRCWPVGGEVDILEAVGGFRGDDVFATYHWGTQCDEDAWTSDLRTGAFPPPKGQNFSDAFHVFALFWNASHMTWAIDDVPYVSRAKDDPPGLFVPSWPLYIILNTAISPYVGPQPPPSDGYPVEMVVDYVKYWQFDGRSSGPGEFQIPYNATGLQPVPAVQAIPASAQPNLINPAAPRPAAANDDFSCKYTEQLSSHRPPPAHPLSPARSNPCPRHRDTWRELGAQHLAQRRGHLPGLRPGARRGRARLCRRGGLQRRPRLSLITSLAL